MIYQCYFINENGKQCDKEWKDVDSLFTWCSEEHKKAWQRKTYGIDRPRESRKLTVKEIFDIINESDYKEEERNSRILSQISIILMKNDIDNLSKETREIKEDIKNLNDKFTVLIDALSIIDQKITKS